jgi:predicted DNA binding CopG/RHH family protein
MAQVIDHKDMVEENLIQAMRDGTVQHGTAERMAQAARTSRNVTIRMAEADLDLARKQGPTVPDLYQVRTA